jgi:hypothetical protein
MRPLALAAGLAALLLLSAVAASGATHTVIPGCGGSDHARYKPTTVILTCGDGGFRISNLKWSRWTASNASGKGTAKVDNCKPNCASGKFESFPAKLTATKPKTCANGKREFTRLAYSFPGKYPSGAKRSGTLNRPCSG